MVAGIKFPNRFLSAWWLEIWAGGRPYLHYEPDDRVLKSALRSAIRRGFFPVPGTGIVLEAKKRVYGVPIMPTLAEARLAALQALRPPRRLALSEWVEANVCLPGSQAVPGPMRLGHSKRKFAMRSATPASAASAS